MPPLRQEYRRARQEGWIPFFLEAAGAFAVRPEVLLAIASRETNMGGRQIGPGKFQWLTTPGDGGHGYGLMQIDRRSFPKWVESGVWRQPRASILKGAEVLAQKRQSLRDRAGNSVRVKTKQTVHTFLMPLFGNATIERVSIAAYNSGDWAAYHASKGRSVDHGTTGRDYSGDVLARATHFRTWLIADGFIEDEATL